MYEFEVLGKNYIFDQECMTIFLKDEIADKATMVNEALDMPRNKYFANVNFIMNNCCNLACEYCYADKGRYDVAGIVIDFETAKTTIDTMAELAYENGGKSIHITFFGGEPLLQFKLIKQIVEYAKDVIHDKNITIRLDIVTNGTLFTDEIIEFMEKENFVITISIDGDSGINWVTNRVT